MLGIRSISEPEFVLFHPSCHFASQLPRPADIGQVLQASTTRMRREAASQHEHQMNGKYLTWWTKYRTSSSLLYFFFTNQYFGRRSLNTNQDDVEVHCQPACSGWYIESESQRERDVVHMGPTWEKERHWLAGHFSIIISISRSFPVVIVVHLVCCLLHVVFSCML